MDNKETTFILSRKLLSLLVLFLLGQCALSFPLARADNSISGSVQNGDGSPIEGAQIYLWKEKALVSSTVSGSSGYFIFDIERADGFRLYVLADEELTPGVDYLPYAHDLDGADPQDLNITLFPAASLVLEGDLQHVRSERVPMSFDFTVETLEPANGDLQNGAALVYGNSGASLSGFIDLEPTHVVVPANTPFSLGVNFSVLVGPQIEFDFFEVERPGDFILEIGELAVIDIRLYSIPFNLEIVSSQLEDVKVQMNNMRGYGFYLASEWKSIESSKKILQSASDELERGVYAESYSAVKRAWIEIEQTHSHLQKIFKDTNDSVSMIIVLLAFTATTIGYLLANSDLMKVTVSVVSCGFLVSVLYVVYPGSTIVPIENYVWTAFSAMTGILLVSRVVPRFFRKHSQSYVPVRNIIIPIFSIAKRSILRRRQRFGLTFTSMTILVMSFVVLTSFYQGYGLITTNLPNQESQTKWVLLRAQGYSQKDPEFLSELEVEMDWLRNQPESASITLKAENIPFAIPITTLNRRPIMGVIGIDPRAEAEIIDQASLFLEGGFPDVGVAISESLRDQLDVELGDTLTLDGERLPLQGVYSDTSMMSLKDIDGLPYLPSKEVNVNPKGEPPSYEVKVCGSEEVVIMPISKALENSMVKISRAVLRVKEGVDIENFATRMVLDKGYHVWATTVEGVFHARLGTFLEGKGQSLVVLFVIVVLNIMMTMLNSVYERKREIHILSSVGLNPAHITSIFFVEAAIIGLTAGGIGYLVGMSAYKAMLFLGITLDVKQKVSAFWSLASVALAGASILIGTFFSLRFSLIITPSHQTRWRIDEEKRGVSDPWEIPIPIKMLPEERGAFFDFAERALRSLENNPIRKTSSMKVIEDDQGKVSRIDFIYKTAHTTIDNLFTRNSLLLEDDVENKVLKVKLVSYGDQKGAYQTGSLIRRIVMRWSIDKTSS